MPLSLGDVRFGIGEEVWYIFSASMAWLYTAVRKAGKCHSHCKYRQLNISVLNFCIKFQITFVAVFIYTWCFVGFN